MLKAYALRHACKEFDPAQKVSDADFAYILETGRLSPSSFGLEPWKFLVLQDKTFAFGYRAAQPAFPQTRQSPEQVEQWV